MCKTKKVIILLLLAVVMLFGVAGCNAGTNELQDQIDSLQSQLEEVKDKLEEMEKQIEQLEKELANKTDEILDPRDEEILKNYHEPTIDENFEDNIVNIIFKKGYSGKIGFDDFKSVEYISEISAIKYDLKTIYKGNKEKFTVSVESSILTLELSEHDKEKVIKIIEQLNKFDMILVSVPNYIYDIVWN